MPPDEGVHLTEFFSYFLGKKFAVGAQRNQIYIRWLF